MKTNKLLAVTALVLCSYYWLMPVMAQSEVEEVCCSHDGIVEPCNLEYRNITPPICAMGIQLSSVKTANKGTLGQTLLETGQIMITGSFYYKDFFGNPHPIRYAPVYIYEYNLLQSLPIAMTITDNNGNFLAGPFENKDSSWDGTNADIQVAVNTKGSRLEVINDILDVEYYSYSNVLSDVPDGVVNLGPTIVPDDQNGAWAAYDALMSGWLYPYYNFGYSAPKVKLHWPDTNWLIFTVPHGAYYVHGGDIYVGLDAATSPDVINHEYGHFLMYSIYNNWLPATENCSNHSAYIKSSEECAWVEGWANFYPVLIFNKTQFDYNGQWFIGVEETQLGDMGDDVEGRVTGFLNDLVDQNNEGFDTATLSSGTIWSIINSTRVQNLSEFWSVWKKRGNNISAGLGTLFQNGIDYCRDSDFDSFEEWPCGGDCNDANANVNPSKIEVCNNIDDNCNGQIDEGFDVDGDGFATCSGDCNDSSSSTHPEAAEICDGIDNNCDGFVPANESDADHDGFRVCQGDCNDTNSAVNPSMNEVCGDGKDNNCNGLIDEICCTDDCAAGDKRCNGNVIQSCDNYDADGCLDWPSSTSGPGNENISTTGYCSGVYYYSCSPSNANCNLASPDGCEVSLLADDTNCGLCGRMCRAGQICSNKKCINFPVILDGDANVDCKVDIFDLAAIGLAYDSGVGGVNWNLNLEFNLDGRVDIFELASVGFNYGKKCSDLNRTLRDESQRAIGEISNAFASGESFASWPHRWELYRWGALVMGAGIKNNASDGKNHSFVINVLPAATDNNIARYFGCYEGISNCYLDQQTSIAKFMSSFVNWSKAPFNVSWNETEFRNITINASALYGTYLFQIIACMSDGTGIDSADKCTAANKWGNGTTLELLVKPT